MNTRTSLDILQVRADFPVLKREVRPGVPLIYLDSTATSQKPNQVIQAMDDFYRRENANIHRGLHTLSEEATRDYEAARGRIAQFIGARHPRQVIYTRNTTESINLVAQTWGRKYLKAGDIILLTEMEHHSNLVPWQILAEEKDLRLEFVPVGEDGLLDQDAFRKLLELQPKLLAFTQMSNVLGTITPAKEMIRLAHDMGAIVLVDGAQSVPHFPVNVAEMDADFLAFSAHKMCGPTGIGILYGKEALLEAMPPFLGGGDMIRRVELRSFTVADLPHKFEAGTPAIAEAIGFGAAVDYLTSIGMEAIGDHEHVLTRYAMERLSEIPGLHMLGPQPENKGGVIAFVLEGIHPHDVAQILDSYGIAIRAGHHCAMPLHQKLHVPASSRASFYLYTLPEEIDLLVEAIYRVKEVFD